MATVTKIKIPAPGTFDRELPDDGRRLERLEREDADLIAKGLKAQNSGRALQDREIREARLTHEDKVSLGADVAFRVRVENWQRAAAAAADPGYVALRDANLIGWASVIAPLFNQALTERDVAQAAAPLPSGELMPDALRGLVLATAAWLKSARVDTAALPASVRQYLEVAK